MACFSLELVKMLLIWLVILGSAVAIVQLLLPLIVGPFGTAAGIVVQALKIIVWAAVAIFVIVMVFDILSCLLGSGGYRLR